MKKRMVFPLRSVLLTPLAALIAVAVGVGGAAVGSAVAAETDATKTNASRTDVLLWPSGGRIQVVKQLPVQDGSVAFVLPVGAQLETLMLSVDNGTVVSRETAPVDSVNPALDGLRAALQEARNQAAVVQGERAAIQARLVLWSGKNSESTGGSVGSFSVTEMQKLDAAMGTRLSELYVEAAALEPRQVQTLRQVERLEQELARKGGDRPEAIRVTARIALSGTDAAQKTIPAAVTVRYSCNISACGWQPVYRLNAFPDKGQVHFVQEAEIVQSTGQDWDGVNLVLASGEPGNGLMPAPLRGWWLQPLRRPQPQQLRSAKMETSPMASMTNDMAMMQPAAVAVAEQATFTTWDLGTQNVRAGVPVRLGLDGGDWKAAFVRVARPSTFSPRPYGASSADAWQPTYLMAKVVLPEAQDFPSGGAQFFVDGLPVGTGTFTLVGDHETIFFGTDTRVMAEMKLDARQSGNKGFVDRQQTRIWKWNIKIRNSHSTPVLVRVEDPEPQSGDEAIVLKVSSSPQPTVEDHVYIWDVTVPGNGKSEISHTVEVSAPKAMNLNEGR